MREGPFPRSVPRSMPRSVSLWPAMHLVEVAEAGELALEEQLDGAGRSVALLGDDQLGLVVRHLHVRLPLGHGFLELGGVVVGELLRRALRQVVLVAVD